jgi:hypothetical protein
MVRIYHKVKHCTDAVKCLANAFDNCANVGFGRLTEQFGRRGGNYHEVEYFTKAYAEEVADALYSKTRNFN